MSDVNPGHGIISVSCEVACDVCGTWMLGLAHPKQRAEQELRGIGWKRIKFKWVCQVCAAEQQAGVNGKQAAE